LEDVVKDAIYNLYGGNAFDGIISFLDIGTNGKFATLWPLVKNIYDVFSVVGVMLVLIYFLMTTMDRTLQQGTSQELFIKSFGELAIALILMVHGYDIMTSFVNLGTAMLTSVQNGLNGTNGGESLADLKWQEIKDGAWSGKILGSIYYIGKYLSLAIPALLMEIGKLLVMVAALSRALEIIIYSLFFPLATADIFKNGMNSSGIRYMKKYLAICLQGAVMVGILISANYINAALNASKDTIGESISDPFYQLGTVLVTVMLIFKSRQIANDVVGV
jgi:hypothetical protein